jgi:hypothetical protein
MRVDVEFIRSNYENSACHKSFEYVSKKDDLSTWLQNGGLLLQEEFALCFNTISEDIIQEIFILGNCENRGMATSIETFRYQHLNQSERRRIKSIIFRSKKRLRKSCLYQEALIAEGLITSD